MNEVKKLCEKINCDALKRIIIGVAVFVVIVLIFGAGMFVGGMKARFSYRWAENYHENFGGPKGGFLNDWRNLPPFPGEFIESRGTFGEIIKINSSTGLPAGQAGSEQTFDLVVKGQNNTEKVILITEKTAIEKGRETIKKDGLKVGDSIVIIGSPNDKGQIEAKLVRLFDGKDIFPNKVK